MNQRIIQSTPFGPIRIFWSIMDRSPKIVRVLLSRPGLPADGLVAKLFPNIRTSSCAEIDAVAAAIQVFLAGKDVVFSLEVADLSACSPFQLSVLRVEHEIPRGRVTTYQQIGDCLRIRNGARAVGNALANNPVPLIVPCHRIIRSDGHLGDYQGGVAMKRALLEREGVSFDAAGRVAEAQTS